MIQSGRQLAAARALLALDQSELGKLANLHRNSVWAVEKLATIPQPLPFAVAQVIRALSKAGVVFFKTAHGTGIAIKAAKPEAVATLATATDAAA